ncbi:hypothetical protein ABMA08_25685 [Pseudomonas yamanorum]
MTYKCQSYKHSVFLKVIALVNLSGPSVSGANLSCQDFNCWQK